MLLCVFRFIITDDIITELPSGTGVALKQSGALDESWIMTQDVAPQVAIVVVKARRNRPSHPPKGTKPRQLRAARNSKKRRHNSLSDETDSNSDSLASSIAIVAGPESRPRTVIPGANNAASSPLMTATLASAKQAAAISAAQIVSLTYTVE